MAVASSATGQTQPQAYGAAPARDPRSLLQGCKDPLQGSADFCCKDVRESQDGDGFALVSHPKLRVLLPGAAHSVKYGRLGPLSHRDKATFGVARLQGSCCKDQLQGWGGAHA